MKLIVFLSLMYLTTLSSFSQDLLVPSNIKPDKEFKNIWSEQIYTDTLATSSVIWIRESVKAHRHDFHTEHVYVLEGSGEMMIGEEHISIVKGDMLIIPKGTVHSVEVTSPEPLKIISIQSPKFNGKDRIFVEK